MHQKWKLKRVLAAAILAVLLLGLIIVLADREPSYQGRSLRTWLQQYSDASLEETQRLSEAQGAVQNIGAKKALPEMLRLLKAKDGPIKIWVLSKTEKFNNPHLQWKSASELRQYAIAGFEMLGTNCATAVGELGALLNDKELAFDAARCLDQIGKAAEPALCQCLTNQDWQVRNLSVSASVSVTDDVEVYLARIKDRLKDPTAAVRFSTVQAIGAQDNAPELAIPLLVTALADVDDAVVGQVANALQSFGTNAVETLPILVSLVNTGRAAQAKAALKALATVAPAEALPILTNAFINGPVDRLGIAFKGLKILAPDSALQMLLNEFHSPDSPRRRTAISLASSYDVNTPGIGDALKLAATDSDPEIAKRATMTMRHMLRKQKDDRGIAVHISGEPSYQGLSLGEWLKSKKEGWQLTPNAAEAISQMGTNAFPALLNRLSYRDPVFNLLDSDVSMEAVGAFISLGERAKPALPALQALMDSDEPDLALRAMLATVGAGADAVPCLMKGLTNRFPDVRNEAANLLMLTGDWASKFPEAKRQALPYIIKLLSDPDETVRLNATNELKQLDSRLAAKAGIK